MFTKALKTINRNQLLSPGDHVIVGLSGGADSVALLFMLLEYQKQQAPSMTLTALHVNHGIRGEAADGDEAFVVDLCRDWQVPLLQYCEDVPLLAKTEGLTVEEAGRKARYDAFVHGMGKVGANKVAVAHHKNDNAETVLMRLCRGTGLKGLGGMAYRRGHIVRPLLDVSRKEIEAYCMEKGLAYRQDASNLEADYTRNSIRLQLIPQIENTLNPEVVEALHRTALLCREEDAFLDKLATDALNQCMVEGHGLKVATLKQFDKPIQRRVLRLYMGQWSAGLKDVTLEHVEALLDMLDKPSGTALSLPKGLEAALTYGVLTFTKQSDAKPITGFCYELPLDVPVYVPEIDQTVCLSGKMPTDKQAVCKAFAIDPVKQPLLLRSRQPGDTIYIEKIGGRQKIKDYCINHKIPRDKRALLPLLAQAHQSHILWICDDKSIVSDQFKIKNAQEPMAYVSLRPGKPILQED